MIKRALANGDRNKNLLTEPPKKLGSKSKGKSKHTHKSKHSKNKRGTHAIASRNTKYNDILRLFFQIIGRTFVKYLDYTTLDKLMKCKPPIYDFNDIIPDYRLIISFCNGFQQRTTKIKHIWLFKVLKTHQIVSMHGGIYHILYKLDTSSKENKKQNIIDQNNTIKNTTRNIYDTTLKITKKQNEENKENKENKETKANKDSHEIPPVESKGLCHMTEGFENAISSMNDIGRIGIPVGLEFDYNNINERKHDNDDRGMLESLKYSPKAAESGDHDLSSGNGNGAGDGGDYNEASYIKNRMQLYSQLTNGKLLLYLILKSLVDTPLESSMKPKTLQTIPYRYHTSLLELQLTAKHQNRLTRHKLNKLDKHKTVKDEQNKHKNKNKNGNINNNGNNINITNDKNSNTSKNSKNGKNGKKFVDTMNNKTSTTTGNVPIGISGLNCYGYPNPNPNTNTNTSNTTNTNNSNCNLSGNMSDCSNSNESVTSLSNESKEDSVNSITTQGTTDTSYSAATSTMSTAGTGAHRKNNGDPLIRLFNQNQTISESMDNGIIQSMKLLFNETLLDDIDRVLLESREEEEYTDNEWDYLDNNNNQENEQERDNDTASIMSCQSYSSIATTQSIGSISTGMSSDNANVMDNIDTSSNFSNDTMGTVNTMNSGGAVMTPNVRYIEYERSVEYSNKTGLKHEFYDILKHKFKFDGELYYCGKLWINVKNYIKYQLMQRNNHNYYYNCNQYYKTNIENDYNSELINDIINAIQDWYDHNGDINSGNINSKQNQHQVIKGWFVLYGTRAEFKYIETESGAGLWNGNPNANYNDVKYFYDYLNVFAIVNNTHFIGLQLVLRYYGWIKTSQDCVYFGR